MDLLFKNPESVFSYRVAGVLKYRDAWLLQKPPSDDGYAFVGGHAAFGETNEQTLRREFSEELGQALTVGRLMAVGEIFFSWGAKPCHQICLYYETAFDGAPSIPVQGIFHGFDDLGGERIYLDYCWVGRERLPQISLYPPQMAQYLLSGSREVMHFIYRED